MDRRQGPVRIAMGRGRRQGQGPIRIRTGRGRGEEAVLRVGPWAVLTRRGLRET